MNKGSQTVKNTVKSQPLIVIQRKCAINADIAAIVKEFPAEQYIFNWVPTGE